MISGCGLFKIILNTRKSSHWNDPIFQLKDTHCDRHVGMFLKMLLMMMESDFNQSSTMYWLAQKKIKFKCKKKLAIGVKWLAFFNYKCHHCTWEINDVMNFTLNWNWDVERINQDAFCSSELYLINMMKCKLFL